MTQHSVLSTQNSVLCLAPFHVFVSPQVFDNHEAQSLIEAVGIVIKHKYHVPEWLLRSSSLIHQLVQESSADAAILKFFQYRNIE